MMTIQKATAEDAATIVEIGKQSFIESHGHSASAADIDSYVSRKYSLDAVKGELEDLKNIFHLIFFNGQAAGYSKIILNVPNENISAQNIACMDRLYLLKGFYGQKLGLHLFELNLEISKQSGQAGMWLYTWVENTRAIVFYTKAGFEIVGKRNFPISETHSNPNHVMYLEYWPQ
jgi:ribosomal protein S18 acetylase RimI-like enzyme